MGLFHKVAAIFVKVTSFFNGPGRRVLQEIMQISEAALPVVEVIAALTPTLADDEIIRLWKMYALPMAHANAWLQLPPSDRKGALLEAATQQLAKQYPDIPIHKLQTAIQLAVTKLKADQAAGKG